MKTLRLVCSLLAMAAFAAALHAANPTGTWKWTTHSPNGDIDTTLKLESKDGKLVGAYSNQFGDAAISKASLTKDVISFEVVRDLDGNSFVVKYHGKLQGDTITGTIEFANPQGGDPVKLDWNAKREQQETAPAGKPKS